MTIGDQDHGGIAMTTATHLAGSVHQSLDLSLGEVGTCNCEVFSGWRAGIVHLFSHAKSLPCKHDWKDNSCFLHSLKLFFSVFVLLSDFLFRILKVRKCYGPLMRREGGCRSSLLPVLNTGSVQSWDSRMGPGKIAELCLLYQ